MFETYGSGEYKKLLVCTSTDVEWACSFTFENLTLLLHSYSHSAQQDCNLHDSYLYPLQLSLLDVGQTSGGQAIIKVYAVI